MPLSPSTLATLHPLFHTSRLPLLVVGLPLVLHHPASCCAPLHCWCSCLSSASAVCHITFRHTNLQLSLCHHLVLFCALWRLSSALTSCHVESDRATKFSPFLTSPANATVTFTSALISVIILYHSLLSPLPIPINISMT